MTLAVKLSSPATSEFWEIPILFEDAELLALNKPSGLRVSPDRNDQALPSLMKLLHRDIERGAPWARERSLSYLMNAHRLDTEASGVIVLAKTKRALIDLASQFGSEPPASMFVALARGSSEEATFTCEAPLAAIRPGRDFFASITEEGKRSRTELCRSRDIFRLYAARMPAVDCAPVSNPRASQIFAVPGVGDETYGTAAPLLSTLKTSYRLKPGHEEKPADRPVAALHAEQITFRHPDTRPNRRHPGPVAQRPNCRAKIPPPLRNPSDAITPLARLPTGGLQWPKLCAKAAS